MFLRRFNALLASRNPAVLRARAFVWGNPLLRETARAGVLCVRIVFDTPRRVRLLIRERRHRLIDALADARAIGGALSLDELERIWQARRTAEIACDMEDPERRQVQALLANTRATVTAGAGRHDAVIVTTSADADAVLRERLSVPQPRAVLRVGQGIRSSYAPAVRRPAEASTAPLRHRIERGEKLRIVLLNDIGFHYGAGAALRRQAMSFRLNGWDVTGVAWQPGNLPRAPTISGVGEEAGAWHGFVDLQRIGWLAETETLFTADVVQTIRRLKADVVVTGNFHGAALPAVILARLKSMGILVMTYMHDVYWITGRCAQPLDCTKFETGCDATCPTPDEHPRLAPALIANAWRERAHVFTGPNRVPLVANSRWTQAMVRRRFGDAAVCELVHLGLDHELFRRIPREVARRFLRIETDKPLVAIGAVDIGDRWKGGPMFRDLHADLHAREDVGMLLFGRSSEDLASTRSFGLVAEELLPFILSAADIFVSTTIADSFGQTLLEASSCGLPVVVSDVGGVKDVVVDGETGLVTGRPSAAKLIAGIDRLLGDPELRARLGAAGRRRVERHFTLTCQADAWTQCLMRFA